MRSTAPLSLMLSLVLTLAAMAVEPRAVIDGPSARPVDKSIVLSGRQSVSERPLQWKLLDRPDTVLIVTDDAPRKSTTAFVLDPEAGEYLFTLVAKGKVGDEWEADVAVHRVVVGGGSPPPGPGPPPDPTPIPVPPPGPTPVPIAETVYATLVYDDSRLATARPEVRTAREVRATAEVYNILWQAYDDDQQSVRALNLGPFVAKAGGVPALILQDSKGHVIDAMPCPPTPEGVVNILMMTRTRSASGGLR